MAERELPSLSILQQPAEFYRFRYASEIDFSSSRLGGVLHGRQGDNSYMQVRVGNLRHCPPLAELRLLICTVSPENSAPHPYYLHGDHCSNGYYLWQANGAALLGREFVDLSLSHNCIVCAKKTPKDLKSAIQRRREQVPALPGLPQEPQMPYNGRNVDVIRLACWLTYRLESGGDELSRPVLLTDTITDKRKQVDLKIADMNPTEFPAAGGTQFGLYSLDPTTGMNRKDIRVNVVLNCWSADQLEVACEIEDVKKHLLLGKTPDIQPYLGQVAVPSSNDERIKAKMAVSYAGSEPCRLDVVFICAGYQPSSPGSGGPFAECQLPKTMRGDNVTFAKDGIELQQNFEQILS